MQTNSSSNIDFCINALKQGKKPKRIAKELNINVYAIYNLIKNYSLRTLMTLDMQKTFEVIKQHENMAEVAAELNITNRAVSYLKAKYYNCDVSHNQLYYQILSDYQKFMSPNDIAKKNKCTRQYVSQVLSRERRNEENYI